MELKINNLWKESSTLIIYFAQKTLLSRVVRNWWKEILQNDTFNFKILLEVKTDTIVIWKITFSSDFLHWEIKSHYNMSKVLMKWYFSGQIGFGAFVMWLMKDSLCNPG